MAGTPEHLLNVRVIVHDADVTVAAEELQHLADELRAVAAARLYSDRQVSMGKAAKLCGLTVAEFVDRLVELHIPVIQYPVEQLRHDLAGR